MMTERDTLHVEGSEFVTRDGRRVRFRGLALSGLEWKQGSRILETLDAALGDWNANCIRLPVRDDFWFGKDPTTSEDGGEGYRAVVDEAVAKCSEAGAYLVLDLHRFKAPTPEHAEFWRDAAVRYAGNPAVIFDLFNEAHSITWDVWLNGGDIPADIKKDGVVAENDFARDVVHTIGHQALIDTVREAGAGNIVIVGGLDWAYDLSGIAQGFVPDDRGGNGIAYASHIYPWKSDFEGKVLCMKDRAPIFVGEVGCEKKPLPFELPENYKDPYVWGPMILEFMEKHRLNWTAWSFHPVAAPRVISDYDCTPTPFWGAFVKSALSGVSFKAP